MIHKSKGQRIVWWQICKLSARECYVFIWGVWREAERERKKKRERERDLVMRRKNLWKKQ